MPIVTVSKTEITPPRSTTWPSPSPHLRKVAIDAGYRSREDGKAVMGSEDVGLFSLNGQFPTVMFWLGASDPAKLAESRKTGKSICPARTRRSLRRSTSQPSAPASRHDRHGARCT
jgi:hypothetical protein